MFSASAENYYGFCLDLPLFFQFCRSSSCVRLRICLFYLPKVQLRLLTSSGGGGCVFDPWSGTKIPRVASLKKIYIYIYTLIHINMHSKNYLPKQKLHWKNLNRQGRLYSRLLNAIEERGKKI